MLAAPTSIASPPSQKSSGCWNPAVPPPPVAGATGGNELADVVCADGDGLGEWLGEWLGVAVLLDEALDVAVPALDGEDVGSDACDEDEQAAITAEASMAHRTQPAAANPARSRTRVIVPCTLMQAPPAPWQKPASHGKSRRPLNAAPRKRRGP
jgi:hypothetical protein